MVREEVWMHASSGKRTGMLGGDIEMSTDSGETCGSVNNRALLMSDEPTSGIALLGVRQ